MLLDSTIAVQYPALCCRKRQPKRLRLKRGGVAAVEMAIVSPFIILMIFASFEFARMMMIKQTLDNAAREGCRRASLAASLNSNVADAAARQYVSAVIKDHDDPSIVRIVATPTFSNGLDSTSEICVEVEVDCEDVSWLPPQFFAGARMRSSCTTRRE